MSRSYKKYPRVKCERSCKFGKRQANKRIRNLDLNVDIPNGKGYKKLYCSYDICDYTCTEFKEWCIQDFEAGQKDLVNGVNNYTHTTCYNTLEECLADWKKDYLCK